MVIRHERCTRAAAREFRETMTIRREGGDWNMVGVNVERSWLESLSLLKRPGAPEERGEVRCFSGVPELLPEILGRP